MIKTIHFDFNEELDWVYQNNKDIYVSHTLNINNLEEVYKDADVITVFIYSRINKDVIDFFPNLKCIICRSAGTDHIDIEYCKKKNIKVKNIAAYWPATIASHAISIFLYSIRSIEKIKNNIKKWIFSYNSNDILDTTELTCWIIWTWKIWMMIGWILSSLWCKIIWYDVYPNKEFKNIWDYVGLEVLLSNSNAIFLACNANQENVNMINNTTINLMKEKTILINIARWSLINEDDLISNINKFRFVGLDCIKNESNEGLNKFREYNNIFITPHIAYLSQKTLKNIWFSTYELNKINA